MAKPYRRRKGKNGKFVGNFRVTIDGRDLNLETKDAAEATRRARLATQGKWPPIDAATAAAVQALDPGAPPPTVSTEAGAAPAVGTPTEGSRAEAPAVSAEPAERSPAGAPPPSEREPLNDAAAAAAVEAGEYEEQQAEAAEAESVSADEVKAAMAELVGPDGDLLKGICDGAGAFTLWLEGWAVKYGIKWGTGIKMDPGQSGPDSMARKCLRVGYHATLLKHFPTIAQNLSPGWAIVIGLGFGAKDAIMEGRIIEADGSRTKVADVVAAAKAEEAAQTAAAATTPAAA